MELSKRLQAVANMLSEHYRVADIGTDHGYLPIYLIEQEKSPYIVAMDINEGPLIRAREHIINAGLSSSEYDRIQIRRSDGVKELSPGEVDSVVLAGMGGGLMIRIMTEGATVFRTIKECILQPQSEIEKVRAFLQEQKYTICKEDMVLEDGKYYPMMKVVQGIDTTYRLMELRYGRQLLLQKHPILCRYLQKEICGKQQILRELQDKKGACIEQRRNVLRAELECACQALQVYGQERGNDGLQRDVYHTDK
ncbi:MAG: class I SAM-dependent methyltransferase [Lachnospiraceae bacterium]